MREATVGNALYHQERAAALAKRSV